MEGLLSTGPTPSILVFVFWEWTQFYFLINHFSQSIGDPFVQISLKCLHSQTVKARELKC